MIVFISPNTSYIISHCMALWIISLAYLLAFQLHFIYCLVDNWVIERILCLKIEVEPWKFFEAWVETAYSVDIFLVHYLLGNMFGSFLGCFCSPPTVKMAGYHRWDFLFDPLTGVDRPPINYSLYLPFWKIGEFLMYLPAKQCFSF